MKLSRGEVRFVNAVAGSGLFVFIETDLIEKLEEEGPLVNKLFNRLDIL